MNWYRPPRPSAPPGVVRTILGSDRGRRCTRVRSKPRARLRPGLVTGMGWDGPAAATFSGRRLGLYLIGAGED